MSDGWFDGLGTGGASPVLLARTILGATILLLLACGIHAALGRRRALVRSGLWNAVLLSMVALPGLAPGLPRLRLACLPARAAAPEVVRPAGAVREVGPSGVGSRFPESARGAAMDPSVAVPLVARPTAEKAGRLATALRILLWIYLAGVAVLSVRLVMSLVAAARLKRTSAGVDDPGWTTRLAYWCAHLGLARPVRVLRSDEVRIPMVLGWFRPAIVLPAEGEDSDMSPESPMDAILLHELAHLRRGDDGWNLLQQVVRVAYWPHPMVWLMDRIIADVREQACDDLCVRWLGGPDRYRSALIAAAMRLLDRPSPTAAPVLSTAVAMARASSSALVRRLRWIERTRGSASCVLPWPGRAGMALAVLGVAAGLSAIEPARGLASTPPRPPFPREEAARAGGGTVRAYDPASVPASAEFRAVAMTVLEDETGRPLADVEVQILNNIDHRDHVFRTDADGRLRFEYPTLHGDPSGNIELRKEGYVPLRYGWGFGGLPNPPDAFTLRLRRGITMGGIVVGEADRPIAGVTVVMSVEAYGPEKRPPNPTGHEIFYEIPLKTGPDGRWRTDSVPPGAAAVNLQLIHPDYVCDGCRTVGWPGRMPKVSALSARTDRQVMLRGVEIRGRVVDEQGRPIAGARVVDSTRGLVFLDFVWRSVTDAEGRFRLHLPREKVVSLTVQARGYQPATREVAPDPDHPDVEFRLPPGKRLKGRVVDPGGRPIAEAWVWIPSIGRHKGVSFTAFTDAGGRFEWDSAPAGPVDFQVGAPGFLGGDFVRLAASDREEVVTLRPAVEVRLDVVDAGTGKALPRIFVRKGSPVPGTDEIRWDESGRGSHAADYRQRFDLKDGPVVLEVSADGYAPARILVPAEPTILREVVRLAKVAP